MLPHYEISHLIAAGGMGAVYAGMQNALDRPVAIKILPPDAARDGESIGRFRTEAKAMARLTHPHIPAVYDFDVSAGYCYLVMEYIDGWNVHQLITQGELNPDLTYSLLSQVCDALHFAHQRGIVHGDIKPSNLLVSQEGTVKLADFGLAQLTGSREDETFSPMGTPEYAAPELWQPGIVMDHRADLYSLGCVFYEMLTGAPPQGQFQLPAATLKLDSRVDSVIARCMQPKPDLRYQSAAEIKQAIDAIRQPASGQAATRPAVRIVRPPGRKPMAGTPGPRRRTKPTKPSPMGWLLALGLAAAVIVIYIVSKPTPAPTEEPPATSPTPTAATTIISPPPATVTAPTSASGSASPTSPPVRETPPAVPAPPPVAPTLSPETSEKLIAFRSEYRAEWQTTVAGRLTTERDRLAAYYLAALEKLREEVSASKDTTTLLAVRNETERFTRTRASLPEGQFSPIGKLASLQKTLANALTVTEAKAKPNADQIRERCLLALKKIQQTAATSDQDFLAQLYDKIIHTPDLALVLKD